MKQKPKADQFRNPEIKTKRKMRDKWRDIPEQYRSSKQKETKM